jgi:CheY-like chemotaxis protein
MELARLGTTLTRRPFILAVGDDPTMLAVFTIAFRRLPVHLMLAENEGEAQHCVEHTPPDLFLVDLQLHGKNGVEMAERVLQGAGQRVPIIVVTAETRHDPIDSYVRSGRCLGCVRKPIALGTFGADILRYLSISTNEIGTQPMHPGSLSPASLEVKFLTSALAEAHDFCLRGDPDLWETAC